MDTMEKQKPRRKHSEEFKKGTVGLVLDGGRTVLDVARSLGLSESVLFEWVRRAKVERAKGAPRALDGDERAELTRLRRENLDLRMERELLKKAAVRSTSQGNTRWNTEAGERNARVFRGRSFSRRAIPFRSAWENPSSGVPFGKYCLRRRLVFSFVPRCQGL